MFAWPAALGDIAIALTAPWMVLALIRRPAFAASRLFVIWHLLGLLDFVVAVGAGALGSMLVADAHGQVTTAPMARLPLAIIPAYLVPLMSILHLTAIMQSRRLAASTASFH